MQNDLGDNDENDMNGGEYYAAMGSMDTLPSPLTISGRSSARNGGHPKSPLDSSNVAQGLGGDLQQIPEGGGGPSSDEHTASPSPTTWKEKIAHLYEKEGLLIEVLAAILCARLYPKLGAVYFFPDITAHWVAVILIFFLSGFALRIEQLSEAASNGKFNAFVLCFNFLGISCVVNFVAKFFYANEVVSEDLMKGMIICSCLSMPTNMMVVLVVASNGDEAIALFLAMFMNLLGVFVTPLLIFLYLQENAEIDFLNTYKTISLRVLLPVATGIFIRKRADGAEEFAVEQKQFFLKMREKCLVYVVYATFCTTFMHGSDSTRSQVLIMALSQVILLASAMFIAWIALFVFFNRQPKLRVVGLFGCTTKTAALGIPLISAIYEDSPKLGMYTLPLLIWYPSQLIIGTILAPRMARFVDYKTRKYEHERKTREFDSSKGCGILEQPSWMMQE